MGQEGLNMSDSIHLVCPNCKQEFQQPTDGLESSDIFTCPACGKGFKNDPKALTEARAQIEEALKKTINDAVRGSKHLKLK